MKTDHSKTSRIKLSRGDTLVEVIITLFVIALGSMVSTSLVINAIRSNLASKNNLVALNLAVEGIEAVRNIRDNNWLKFSFNKDECWNMEPEALTNDSCVAVALIPAGFYTVDLDPQTMKWTLSRFKTGLDLENNPGTAGDFVLRFINLNNGDSARYLFLSKSIILGAGITVEGDSPYYRMLEIDYGGTAPENAEEMRVKSLVEWQEGAAVKRVSINTILTNYNRVKVNP